MEIIRQLPNATAILDSKLNFFCVSVGWDTLFSTKALFKGKDIITQMKTLDSNWHKQLQKSIATNKEITHSTSLDNATNTLHINWIFKPLSIDDSMSGVIISAEDTTTVTNKEIEKLEKVIETKAEISKIGTWEYDIKRNTILWSKMTKTIYGVTKNYKPDLESTIEFFKHGYNRNKVSLLFHDAIEKGDKFHESLQITTKKGNENWVIISAKPEIINDEVTKLYGTLQDVTKQVLSEIKVRENQQLLTTLVNNLPLNIFIKDNKLRKILVNKAECDFFGARNESKLIGKTDFDFYPKEIAEGYKEDDMHVLKTLQPILSKESVIKRKDGNEITFLTSKIPLIDIYGKANGIIGINIDISSLKQKEKELHDLINVTSIQNKKLINFAHIVSHNLRSQTANFSLLVEFLAKEKKEKEKKKIVDMLTNTSKNLHNTITNLNEVVKIDANTNLDKEKINLKDAFTTVQESLNAIFKKNNVVFKNQISKEIFIEGIPSYLESIISNLLTNAVKYKHPERNPIITVKAKLEKGKVTFSVKDNGLGIDLRKNGDKVFGMYKTFHNNKDARGIGLYITKSQVEAMGGTITVKSEINKGSIFKVNFK